MTDDIVTRLRYGYRVSEIPSPMPHFAELLINAADEIERLRELAEALYEETKKCGSKHDVKATNDWEEYIDGVRGE